VSDHPNCAFLVLIPSMRMRSIPSGVHREGLREWLQIGIRGMQSSRQSMGKRGMRCMYTLRSILCEGDSKWQTRRQICFSRLLTQSTKPDLKLRVLSLVRTRFLLFGMIWSLEEASAYCSMMCSSKTNTLSHCLGSAPFICSSPSMAARSPSAPTYPFWKLIASVVGIMRIWVP
jgi:hypothetical protein